VNEILELVVKGLVGGALVVVFTVLGHLLRPKWFAGLFGAAPSVAIASLSVTVLSQGNHAASLAAAGMCFGAAGFVAFSACVLSLLGRYHAVVAASASCIVWVVVAVGAYLVVVG
jgi:uncharacterized membrane protein (GlpM family)